jgi:hypothetical protein
VEAAVAVEAVVVAAADVAAVEVVGDKTNH